ncbi:MAG: S8 family serine peptidase [Acidobacteria bacterium]|nr:S8 family serine peptidase [Acidobacteriota bacterium]
MRLRAILAIVTAALLMNAAWGGSGGKNVIVKLKPGESIRRINKDNDAETLAHIPNTRIYLIRVDDYDDKALRKLRRDSGVEAAEADRRFRLTSASLNTLRPRLVQEAMLMLDGTTMTSFNGSTVLTSYAEQPAVKIIHVDTARKLSTGAGTDVGFMDTGVDFNHQALAPWLRPGVNVLSQGSASELNGLSQEALLMLDQEALLMLDPEAMLMLDGSPLPKFLGHGTLVAGLIHLVAPDARLVPIKAFDANGYTTIFAVLTGVYWAIDQHLDVLNLSFSTEEDSDILHKAIDQARMAGTAVIASTGNDAHEGRDVYPAGWGNVYGVAATDLNDRLAIFSNYGKSVTVTAPGSGVVSTFPSGKYAVVWGTSFSAPLVSGAVALIASGRGFGQSDAASVVTTAESIDGMNPGFERKLGKGRINAYEALRVKK